MSAVFAQQRTFERFCQFFTLIRTLKSGVEMICLYCTNDNGLN